MSQNIPFENGTLTLTPLQDNAVRIRYSEGEIKEMTGRHCVIRYRQVSDSYPQVCLGGHSMPADSSVRTTSIRMRIILRG